MSNKIELIDLHKSFGAKLVLNGVNLEIPKGKSTVIIGGSGTGKSVTLKCILGLVQPDKGTIKIDGTEQNKSINREFLNNFGMLFQGAALFDSLKIWENVAFKILQGKEHGSKSDAKEFAIQKLKRVGLPADISDQYPAELSGGMQKRVGLARAIATNPDVIFFDEPTTGLDPIMASVINELIRDLVEELGATALTITHDMSSVRAIADRVAMLHDGRICWNGGVSEIDQSGNEYVDQFVNGRTEGPIHTIK